MGNLASVQIRSQYDGALSAVVPRVRQIFQRFDLLGADTEVAESGSSNSMRVTIVNEPQKRLAYFVEDLLPQLRANTDGNVFCHKSSHSTAPHVIAPTHL